MLQLVEIWVAIFDYVTGWIDDGVVTLTGYVTHGYKAGKMAELVSRVQGVREIQNQIEALPVSSFDDQLRASIARQIYGNVLMPHVRIAAPLHIIVRHRGTVTCLRSPTWQCLWKGLTSGRCL